MFFSQDVLDCQDFEDNILVLLSKFEILKKISLSLLDFKGRSPKKKTVKKGDIVPFWRPPPLNGSKGDICCLITDKSA